MGISQTKPTWRRTCVVTLLSLYPWFTLMLYYLHIRNASGWSVMSTGGEVILFLMVLSVLNLLISLIFIACVIMFNPDSTHSKLCYFFAINSISSLWIFLPTFLF